MAAPIALGAASSGASAASSIGSAASSGLASGIGSGISGMIGGLGQGLIGQLFAGMNARRDYKYFKKKSNYAAQLQDQYLQAQEARQLGYTEKLRDYDNAYNSAASQVQRLREAGLNPGAALSSGGAGASFGTSDSGSAPGSSGAGIPGMASGAPSSPSFSAVNLEGASRARLNNAMASEIENRTQDPEDYSRAFDANIERSLSNALNSRASASLTQYNESYARLMQSTNYLTAQQEYSNLVKEGRILSRHVYAAELDNQIKGNILHQQAMNLLLSAFQCVSLEAGVRLTNAEISKISHEIDEIDARTDLEKAQTALTWKKEKYEGWRAVSEIALNYCRSFAVTADATGNLIAKFLPKVVKRLTNTEKYDSEGNMLGKVLSESTETR